VTRAARTALAVAALAAPLGAGDAVAAPTAELTFSSTAPAASTAFHAKIGYSSTDLSNRRRALRGHVLTFPAGTVYDSAAAEVCQASAAELRSQGLGACPPDSKVGGGTLRAIGSRPPASAGGTFPTDLTIFNASHPKDAPSAEDAVLVAVSVGGQVQAAFAAPLEANVMTENTPVTCSSPTEQPPCPSGEFTVESVDYTIGEHTRTVGGNVHRLITTPPSCPASASWEFSSLRRYDDGFTERVDAISSCGRQTGPVPQRLALSVSPGAVRRCRARRFVFTARAGSGALTGARVRFANRTAVTGEDGRAAIVARLCRAGARRATVKAEGFRKGTATVRVVG
jgi:hypothetical protein